MKKYFLALFLTFVSLMASLQAQITAPAVEVKPETDSKYLVGAVPKVNDYAVLTRVVEVDPLLSAEQEELKIHDWIERCMKDERVRYNQPVSNSMPGTIQHMCTVELTFSKSFIAHDFADLTYVLAIDTTEKGKVTMTMTHIAFKYNEGGKPVKYAAEGLIADDIALNKKGRIIYGYKKFRMKTIDLMDELAISLQRELAPQK